MRKSYSGLTALMITAVMPLLISSTEYGSESPLTVGGDSAHQRENQEDGGSDTAMIIEVVIAIFIIICCIAVTNNQSHAGRWRVGWKLS